MTLIFAPPRHMYIHSNILFPIFPFTPLCSLLAHICLQRVLSYSPTIHVGCSSTKLLPVLFFFACLFVCSLKYVFKTTAALIRIFENNLSQ